MDEVTAALRDVEVPADAILEIPIELSDESALAFKVDGTIWFDVWKSLRLRVPNTGRWPLAVATWSDDAPVLNRFDTTGPDGLDPAPAAIMGRVRHFDIDAFLAVYRREREVENGGWHLLDDYLDRHLAAAPGLGAVAPAVMRQALGPQPTMLQVDRWIIEQQQAQGVVLEADKRAWYLEWQVPEVIHILLLPEAESWTSGAYVGGYDWGYPHTDIRTAVLRRWQERHGAVVAANWGTSLQFVVERPPLTIDEAWTVAEETNLLWSDTAGGRNGVDTYTHARDLVGRDTWYVVQSP